MPSATLRGDVLVQGTLGPRIPSHQDCSSSGERQWSTLLLLCVVSADWNTSPRKRWAAVAARTETAWLLEARQCRARWTTDKVIVPNFIFFRAGHGRRQNCLTREKRALPLTLILRLSARLIGSTIVDGDFLMRAVAAIVLTIWATLLFVQPAFAEKRVALVIGNSAYQNVGRLTNPVNDSGVMAATFKSAGFDVVELRRDLKATEMRRALRDFSDNVRDADIAIVYYAGHGIEIDGTNYLIPVDAALERDIDAFDEAIPLDRILTVIEPAKQLRLVILDACRDNPFNKTMKRTTGSRAVGRGLAKVEPASPNTLIAFAAKAGSTASDGDNKNSPFTAALVKYLPKPGLDLRKAFGFARDDVLKATNNRQEPFIYGSLGGDDVALVPAAAAPPLATISTDPNAAIRHDYELAERIGTKPVWDSFIGNNPSGFYTDLAKAQRDKLDADAASVVATEKAKGAVNEQKRLAIEGAKVAEQAKAAAQTKAAEEARVAAEKKKAIDQAKVVEAERATVAAQATATEDARIAAAERKAAEEKKGQGEKPIGQLANVTPEQTDTAITKMNKPAVDGRTIVLEIKKELMRVGCYTGRIDDDNWTTADTKASLRKFAKFAKLSKTPEEPRSDLLESIRGKSDRVCPQECMKNMTLSPTGSCIENKGPATSSAPAKGSSPRPETEPPRAHDGGSCDRMKDPVGCNCALKTGGYIYASPRSHSGYRFRWNDGNAYTMCLYAAGRR